MAERVLVVDDDESLLEICETSLRVDGYQVSTAFSGTEALQKIAVEEFDLVLTDLKMPGNVDGRGVVRGTKEKRPGTEVIVMTATPTLQTAIETLKDGAYDYIIKPFVMEHLLAVVRRCLDTHRLRQELSSERALRQELDSAYKELQKVEALKESIMARVSHELRTPLSELNMALHLMETTLPEGADKTKKYIHTAKEGYLRLDRTLSSLIAFSDMSKKTELEPREPIELEGLCREIVEGLKPLWEPRKIEMKLEFDPNCGKVDGSRASLKKAFEHVVHNAISFNRTGGKVGIRGRISGGMAEVAISDTGDGIPKEEFDEIFDSFYQVANYLIRKVDGLGLGLAIARRIVEAHGGVITVNSTVGQGSTFTISLPPHP